MYTNIISGKTGFTCDDAGYCYVCAYKDDNRTFIVALLACGWQITKPISGRIQKLLDYGREKYNVQTVYDKDSPLEPLSVWDGLKYNDFMPYADINENLQLLLSDKDNINVTINYNDVQLPIYKNDVIGNIKIYVNDKIWNVIDIKSNTDIEKIRIYRLF